MKKHLFIILTIILLFSTYSPYVSAQVTTPTTPEGGTAGSNAMSRTMLEYFKTESKLDTNSISKAEAMVYGVYLSNFMHPYKTTIGDLKDKGKTASVLSQKFFGSESNADEVQVMNTIIYDGIYEKLSDPTQSLDWALYSSKAQVDKAVPMEGKTILTKLAGKNGDTKIYRKNGKNAKEWFDLDSKNMQLALKMLFAYSPEMFLNPSKGLIKAKELYMDGFGNIWGRPEKEKDVNKYVLIMPAVMNPLVFNNKIPVANVFATGAILKAEGERFSAKNLSEPYYNYVDNTTNRGVMSIVGIQSASKYIGKSNDVIKKKAKGMETKDTAKKFLTSNILERVGTNKVFFNFDITSGVADTSMQYIGSLKLSTAQNKKLISILGKTVVADNSDLNQTMYFFDTGKGSQAVDTETAGNWNDSSNLTHEFKLFDYKKSGGKETFYTGSVINSPFLHSATKSKEGRNARIDQYTGLESAEEKALAEVMEKMTTSNKESFRKALEVVVEKDVKAKNKDDSFFANSTGASIFGSYQGAMSAGRTFSGTANYFKWIKETAGGWQAVGEMLTASDSALVQASVIGKSGWFDNMMIGNNNNKDTVTPFKIKSGSTEMTALTSKKFKNKTELTEAENRFMEMFYLTNIYRVYTTNTKYLQSIEATRTKKNTKVSSSVGDYQLGTDVADQVNNFAGIYWAYLKDLIQLSIDAQGNITAGTFNNSYLPDINLKVIGTGFATDNLFSANGTAESGGADNTESGKGLYDKLVSLVYNLVTPDVNVEKMGFLKGLASSFFLSTHRGLTNSWNGATSVLTSTDGGGYSPELNFIKSPALEDLPFASSIVGNYVFIYLIIMFVVLIVILFTVILGINKLGSAVGLLVITALLLVTPQYYVGAVSSVNNKLADSLLSEKFVFWAIVQQQKVENVLQSATEESSGETESEVQEEADLNAAIVDNMQTATDLNTGNTSALNNNLEPQGVRLKWMAPKRIDEFNRIFGQDSADSKLLASQGTVFKWLTRSYFYEEEFVYDDALATYLYKPYNSIVSDASSNYNHFVASESEITLSDYAHNLKAYKQKDALFSDENFSIPFNGLGMLDKELKYTKVEKELLAEVDTYRTSTDTDINSDFKHRYWGLTNKDVTKAILRTEYTIEDAGLEENLEEPSYTGFTLLTESPYTYFYNVLRNRYASDGTSFKQSLLSKRPFITDTRNTTSAHSIPSNEQIRDFLDLEGLFTYVVPYLHESNEYVYGWTSKFGTDIPTFDFANTQIEGDSEYAEQFAQHAAKKEALGKVWTMYSPWVDQIQNTKSQDKVKLNRSNSVSVGNTLNPSHYAVAGREMAFSPAEMKAHGLTNGMLTEEEKKIHLVLEKTYEDLMYLNNYRQFSEESLLAVAAMLATFNFNEVFSKVSVIGESSLLYPQSFEVKNFNYDAFMKMIMIEATGESVLEEKDIYQTVLEKTSPFTGIVLIITDIMGIYVVPITRLITLSLLFFLVLTYVATSILAKPDQLLHRTYEVILKPSVLYVVFTSLFTFFVYKRLGDNSQRLIEGRHSSGILQDPTMAMIALILLCLVYTVLMVWLIFKLFKSLLEHIKLLTALVSKLATQGLSLVTDSIKGLVSPKTEINGDTNNRGDISNNNLPKNNQSLGMAVLKARKSYIAQRDQKRRDSLYSHWLEESLNSGAKKSHEYDKGNSSETRMRRYGGKLEKTTSLASKIPTFGIPLKAVGLARSFKNSGVVQNATAKLKNGALVGSLAGARTLRQTPMGTFLGASSRNTAEKLNKGLRGTSSFLNSQSKKVAEGLGNMKTSVFDKFGNVVETGKERAVRVHKKTTQSKTFNFLSGKGANLRDKLGRTVTTGKETVVNSSYAKNLQQVKRERLSRQLNATSKDNKNSLASLFSRYSFQKTGNGTTPEKEVKVYRTRSERNNARKGK